LELFVWQIFLPERTAYPALQATTTVSALFSSFSSLLVSVSWRGILYNGKTIPKKRSESTFSVNTDPYFVLYTLPT
jgi:hypothetical protein